MTGAGLWIQSRNQERNVNHIGISEQIYPPVLRVRKAGGIQEYFERAARLQAHADSRRKAIADDDVSDSGIGDESLRVGGR